MATARASVRFPSPPRTPWGGHRHTHTHTQDTLHTHTCPGRDASGERRNRASQLDPHAAQGALCTLSGRWEDLNGPSRNSRDPCPGNARYGWRQPPTPRLKKSPRGPLTQSAQLIHSVLIQLQRPCSREICPVPPSPKNASPTLTGPAMDSNSSLRFWTEKRNRPGCPRAHM